MTQEFILENNKLLAEFMGWEYAGAGRKWIFGKKYPYYKRNSHEPYLFIEDFGYHDNWNELMDVVRKIELLGYTVEMSRGCCRINFKNNGIWRKGTHYIESIYIEIVYFIKRYNKNKVL